MSRADKQFHQEHIVGTALDTNVRLYAFANTQPGYQVVFSPEAPLILLKSKMTGEAQHPCKQWEPFSNLIFHAKPNTTHAVYVADTTAMSAVPQYDQEEVVNGAAIGPLMKRLSNTIAKLNPHNAIMVAAGVTAHLALKYMLVGEKSLGHRDRLVARLVLVCPASLADLQLLVKAVLRKPREEGYPLPEVTVLLKDPSHVEAWSTWLRALQEEHQRIASFHVTTDLTPSLFAAIAREAGLLAADGTQVDTQQRYAVPRVYRIDFILSKATKSIEQLPRLSPLDTLGVDETGPSHGHGHGHHHEDGGMADSHDGSEGEDDSEEYEDWEDEEGEEGEGAVGHGHDHHRHHDPAHGEASCCGGHCDDAGEGEEEASGSMLVGGLNTLPSLCDPVRVIVEGRVLDVANGLIGTTEGCVVVTNFRAMVEEDPALASFLKSKQNSRKPPAVSCAAMLQRDASGRTTLVAEEASPMSSEEVRNSMTAGRDKDEIPMGYNVSLLAHSYGVLLVRDRKCVLVRSLSGAFNGMRLPYAPHDSAEETSMDCAIRALCDQCDFSSDNFYMPSFLPPVAFYVPEREGLTIENAMLQTRCVTIFTALAVCPAPRGVASDGVEDAPEPGEPYDWVSFDRAIGLLESEAEREALREAQQHLQKAYKAHLYAPFPGCKVFGEAVKPL